MIDARNFKKGFYLVNAHNPSEKFLTYCDEPENCYFNDMEFIDGKSNTVIVDDERATLYLLNIQDKRDEEDILYNFLWNVRGVDLRDDWYFNRGIDGEEEGHTLQEGWECSHNVREFMEDVLEMGITDTYETDSNYSFCKGYDIVVLNV